MRFRFMACILALTLAVPVLAVADGQSKYRYFDTATGRRLPYAVHFPPGYDPDLAYPVLIGPGDGEKGSEPGFYWRTDPNIAGWIIVDAQIWEPATRNEIGTLLDTLIADLNVEGGKFHTVCWSANCAGIFRLVTDNATRFHSVTGMAGNPDSLTQSDIEALQSVKTLFVVGENDSYWRQSAREVHDQLVAGGVASVFEVVPNGEHVMTGLIGAPLFQKLGNLR